MRQCTWPLARCCLGLARPTTRAGLTWHMCQSCVLTHPGSAASVRFAVLQRRTFHDARFLRLAGGRPPKSGETKLTPSSGILRRCWASPAASCTWAQADSLVSLLIAWSWEMKHYRRYRLHSLEFGLNRSSCRIVITGFECYSSALTFLASLLLGHL